MTEFHASNWALVMNDWRWKRMYSQYCVLALSPLTFWWPISFSIVNLFLGVILSIYICSKCNGGKEGENRLRWGGGWRGEKDARIKCLHYLFRALLLLRIYKKKMLNFYAYTLIQLFIFFLRCNENFSFLH